MAFERYILHIEQKKARIVNDFEVTKKYILGGIINCPTAGHYTGILNFKDDIEFLSKGKNYYYDNLCNKNKILLLENNHLDYLNTYYPYILIYEIS